MTKLKTRVDKKHREGKLPQAHQKIPLWFTEKPEIKSVKIYKLDPSKLDEFIRNNN
ncbi:hypothetical protein [Nostoc sp. CCY 9925]|uniref:hypothetical protein n=1 Tax=Nostoc sp. CCY 9925 TaxID=3103865 RepID=UPI0039C74C02